MKKAIQSAKQELFENTDWVLLVFLLLFLDVKMIVKLLALVFIYISRPYFRFGFKLNDSRLPLFYPAVIIIGITNYIITSGFLKFNYTIAFSTGIFFWVLCILAINQVKLATERTSLEKLQHTLTVFFMLNVAVTGFHLFRIIIEIGEWNPYTYQGLYQKYFIGTGDYIKGITLDTSTTNAVINSFGVLFFLNKNKFVHALLCMAALLLTCSNFVNIIVIIMLLWCFLFQSTRPQKSIIVVCFCLVVIFMAKVSPQNNQYVLHTFERIFTGKVDKKKAAILAPIELRADSTLSSDEKKYKEAKLSLLNAEKNIQTKATQVRTSSFVERPALPKDNIHSAPFQHRQDSSAARLQVIHYAMGIGRDTSVKRVNAQRFPGKLLAVQQTAGFLKNHPSKILLGAGIGNFSSKLAFRAIGLQVAGGYPEKYVYVNNDFRQNQLAIFLDYFGKDSGFHSVTNSPNNTYVQMFAEYGIIGAIALFFLYGWFFAKRAGSFSYSVPLFILVGCLFFVEYWFEQLSILVLFELLMFLLEKEKRERRVHE